VSELLLTVAVEALSALLFAALSAALRRWSSRLAQARATA
jgi:hypothetical protein